MLEVCLIYSDCEQIIQGASEVTRDGLRALRAALVSILFSSLTRSFQALRIDFIGQLRQHSLPSIARLPKEAKYNPRVYGLKLVVLSN